MGYFWPNGVGSRRELLALLRETDVRDHTLVEGESFCGCTVWKTVASCYRGCSWSGVLWSVVERWDSVGGAASSLSYRFIRCDVIRCDRNGWHYKPLRSSDHPCWYSCPQRYLDMTESYVSHCNESWRAMVRERHAQRRLLSSAEVSG